jgi:hypothetical protein
MLTRYGDAKGNLSQKSSGSSLASMYESSCSCGSSTTVIQAGCASLVPGYALLQTISMVISGVVRNTRILAKTLCCHLVITYGNTASPSTPILGPIQSLWIQSRSKMNWSLEAIQAIWKAVDVLLVRASITVVDF